MRSRGDIGRTARPAYFTLPLLDPDRERAPTRECGLWGELEVEAECLTEIHVGGTAPVVAHLDGRPTLIHGMTRVPAGHGQVPIIPGSSVKGAVRATVEAITPSCDRLSASDRRSRERNGACRSPSSLCPACAAFGAPGWRAMVAFSDLLTVEPVELTTKRVAQRYSHPNAPRRGRRLYGLHPEEPLPSNVETLECLPAGSRLRAVVRFEGLAEALAGAITLALGLPPHGLPLLRLGAGKNRGLAQVRVTLRSSVIAHGWTPFVNREVAPIDVGALQESAFRRWPVCQARADEIRARYQNG